MRVNGYLVYRIPAAEGTSYNDDGEPVFADSTQSDQIECWIQTNTHSEKGVYADGKFTQASYEVLLQRGSLPKDVDFVHIWRGAKDLGEFEVQDRQHISLDRIKLTL